MAGPGRWACADGRSRVICTHARSAANRPRHGVGQRRRTAVLPVAGLRRVRHSAQPGSGLMPTFDDVRRIALALPEAEERVTWDVDITFRVRDKIFATGGPDGTHASIKASPDRQGDLVDLDPETFAASA